MFHTNRLCHQFWLRIFFVFRYGIILKSNKLVCFLTNLQDKSFLVLYLLYLLVICSSIFISILSSYLCPLDCALLRHRFPLNFPLESNLFPCGDSQLSQVIFQDKYSIWILLRLLVHYRKHRCCLTSKVFSATPFKTMHLFERIIIYLDQHVHHIETGICLLYLKYIKGYRNYKNQYICI